MNCPKCKDKDVNIIVEQEYTTTIQGYKDNIDLDDMASGWSDLYDWLENMLVEKGKQKIIGCEDCIN